MQNFDMKSAKSALYIRDQVGDLANQMIELRGWHLQRSIFHYSEIKMLLESTGVGVNAG